MIARDAARHRAHLSVSLAVGFAIATAQHHDAELATFDRTVRRALRRTEVRLTPTLK